MTTPLSPALRRVMAGTAVINLAVGLLGTWEAARALFAVALAYGLVALVAVPIQLAADGGPRSLWVYVAVDAMFIGPIAATVWVYERKSRARV